MTPSDERLVEAFQAGDLAAFDLLVLRWERKVQGTVYRVLGTEEDARDVTQEAFLKAFRSLHGFKGEARFSSWLYQIALNLCRDRLRRKRGRAFVSFDSLEEDGGLPAHSGLSPYDLAERGALCGLVRGALAELPDEQREVIVLKEYQELTFAEIAEILDVPLSTVKTRLYRGLVGLRGRLERQGLRGTAAVPGAVQA
ncbi:MAG TPA: sigma-70 family RNA polymerase sigma factor [Vicinamibacteria bacterium]|nr:sigma-70 family RNA polymerase sigma factor [Vicinamibacteria bacterium]